ncbi:hypothetical protein [Paracoccus sp. (in: a-proteobacteria)]|uniref:hypothetical protein n=1 Tax=Paracoccus sp. TaxID=267 RepID=UPI003A895279
MRVRSNRQPKTVATPPANARRAAPAWLLSALLSLAVALIPMAHRPVSATALARQQAMFVYGFSDAALCGDPGQENGGPGQGRDCPACHLVKAMALPPAPDLWFGATHQRRIVWNRAPRQHFGPALAQAPLARGPPSLI